MTMTAASRHLTSSYDPPCGTALYGYVTLSICQAGVAAWTVSLSVYIVFKVWTLYALIPCLHTVLLLHFPTRHSRSRRSSLILLDFQSCQLHDG